jgi:hypothetical protein
LTPVWVDLAQAQRAISVKGSPDAPVAQQPGAAGQSVFLPAEAASDRGREEAEFKRAKALAIMRAERDAVVEELASAYRHELEARAKVAETALRELLAEHTKNASEQFVESISAAILSEVGRRGHLVARLALLAGWPDDGKSNFERFARTGQPEKDWEAEAATVRGELRELDARVDTVIRGILENSRLYLESERAAIGNRIKQLYESIAGEAAKRVSARLRERAAQVGPSLLSRAAGELPSHPATSVSLPAVGASAVAGDAPPIVGMPAHVLLHRLNTWLRVRGYILVRNRAAAEDRTGEFIAWNQQQ